MQVILQETIESLGKAGDVVTVKEGYGRNFLLPKKKAVVADPHNLRMLEHEKRVVAKRQEKLKAEANEFKAKLEKATLTLKRESGAVQAEATPGKEAAVEEKLFGSVTSKDIAEALRHEGFNVDRHWIRLDEPIRKLGRFEIPVKLHAEVTAMVKVDVVKK